MPHAIHANARTTPRTGREIQQAPPYVTNAEFARRYGVHRHTIAKGRKRSSIHHRSARPHRLSTTLDQLCEAHGIGHRLIKPRHPQTNGMVERFNTRIAEILQVNRFDSSKDLRKALHRYRWAYNHQIPQHSLGHITPIQALQQWEEKRPDLFVKKEGI